MKKKRRGLNLRYKTLKRWWRQRGGSPEESDQIKTFIKSILNGTKCEFIDVAFVPHLTTYINSDAKYTKSYISISPTDEAFMGFPYPQQTPKATSTDRKKFEEGLGSAPTAGGGAMSGGLPLMKNSLDKLKDIKTNLDKLNEKIGQYKTFFDISLNDYSQNNDISLNEIFGSNGQDKLHNRELLQKILKEGNIVYEKDVFVKTYGKDNTKIKRDVFDKGDYKFFNELINMKGTEWDANVNKKSGLLSKQNLFDLLTKIATRMNDVDAGPNAGLEVTKKIVESITQITLENIKKKSFLGIIALFLSIYTGFNKCQEDFDEWKKNYNGVKDTIDIQKIYQEIENTLAKYKTQFDDGTIGGISEIRTTAATTQMNTEINEAKELTTKAIMNNPTTNLTLIEKLKIKYYLQYLAYSFIVPNEILKDEIKKNQCINVLNKIKNIVTKNPIAIPVVAPALVSEGTVQAAVETPQINAASIDALLILFTDESISGDVMIARKNKLTELLTPKGAIYEAIYILEANLNFLRAKMVSNGSVTKTTTNIYELLDYVIGNKDLNNMYQRQGGGGVQEFDSTKDDELINSFYKTLTDVIIDKISKVQSTDKATIEGIVAKAPPPKQLSGPQQQRETSQRSMSDSVQPSGKPSAEITSIREESVRNQQISRNMNSSSQVASALTASASAASASEQAPGEIVGLTLQNGPSSDVILKLRAIPPQAWASTTYNTTEGNIRNLGADMMGSNDCDNTHVLLDILRTEKALDEIEVKLNPINPNLLVLTANPLDAAAKDDIKNQLDELNPMIEKFRKYLEVLKSSENKQGGGGQVGGKRTAFNQVPNKEEIQSLLEYINTKTDLVVDGKKPTFEEISPKLVVASKDFFDNSDNLNKWKEKDSTMTANPITTKNLYIKIFNLIFKSELFKNQYDTFTISSMKDLISSLFNFFTSKSEKGDKVDNTFSGLWTEMLKQSMAKNDPNAGKIKGLEEKIAQLEKDLAKAKKQIAQLEGQIATLTAQQNEKQREIDQLKAATAAAEARAAKAQEDINLLTADQNTKKTQHDAALKALEEAKSKIKSDLETLKSSTNQTDKNKAAELQKLNDKNAELNKKITEENEKFQRENATLNTQLTALQAQLEQKNTEAERLNATNAALIKKKEDELAKINQQMAELQSQIDAANSTNTKSSAEMEALKKQLEASQEELGTTKKTLETTKVELDVSKGQCERNDAKVKELTQKLADKDKLLEKNQQDLDKLEKDSLNFKMGIIKLLEYHIERYEGFLTKIKSDAATAVEVLPESASNLKVESTTNSNVESTVELDDKSTKSKLGDGNTPSS